MESKDTASHCYPRQPKGFPRCAGALIKQSKAELKASTQKRISGLKQSWGLIKLCYYGHQDENCGNHTLWKVRHISELAVGVSESLPIVSDSSHV